MKQPIFFCEQAALVGWFGLVMEQPLKGRTLVLASQYITHSSTKYKAMIGIYEDFEIVGQECKPLNCESDTI